MSCVLRLVCQELALEASSHPLAAPDVEGLSSLITSLGAARILTSSTAPQQYHVVTSQASIPVLSKLLASHRHQLPSTSLSADINLSPVFHEAQCYQKQCPPFFNDLFSYLCSSLLKAEQETQFTSHCQIIFRHTKTPVNPGDVHHADAPHKLFLYHIAQRCLS